MTLRRCAIGLGSNLGDPVYNLQSAINRIGQRADMELLRCSRLYHSPPWGRTEQPEFVNAVALLETSLEADDLLILLLSIETALGRERDTDTWGPRIIDIDLLLYGDLVQSSEALRLPHPLMHKRAFVLVPLLEIDPDCHIPGKGRADSCLQRLGQEEIDGIIPVEAPTLDIPASA